MGMANPQMKQASEEFRKNSLNVYGMPLVEYSSFGMASNGQNGQAGDTQSANQTQPPPAQPSSNNDSTPTNPRYAVAKSLGGLFKKKHQQQADNTCNSARPQPGSP